MTLYADATALIALGAVDRIALLRFWPDRVVITPGLRNEVRTSAAQIDRAIDEGWMQVSPPDPLEVERLMTQARLHQGEAETIDVATRLGDDTSAMLIDEARAFRYLAAKGNVRILCLAQVLHELERRGSLASCRQLMEHMVNAEAYGWAKRVRQHYETWCKFEGTASSTSPRWPNRSASGLSASPIT
jgi:predicted nucleic acid-binding protein